jgi:hypothetical protein
MGWQITLVTIYCDAVDEEVTIAVRSDWSVQCTGYKKYCEPEGQNAGLLKSKSASLKRQLKCEGLECRRVTQYKEKLAAEETSKGSSASRNKETSPTSGMESGR